LNKWQKIAFSLYLLVILLLALRAMTLIASDVQPYQMLTVGTQNLAPEYQQLIAFLNAFGGSIMLVYCLSVSILLLIPYRQSVSWASFAVPALLLAYCAASILSMWQVKSAQPPIGSAAVLALITMLAFVISRIKTKEQ